MHDSCKITITFNPITDYRDLIIYHQVYVVGGHIHRVVMGKLMLICRIKMDTNMGLKLRM